MDDRPETYCCCGRPYTAHDSPFRSIPYGVPPCPGFTPTPHADYQKRENSGRRVGELGGSLAREIANKLVTRVRLGSSMWTQVCIGGRAVQRMKDRERAEYEAARLADTLAPQIAAIIQQYEGGKPGVDLSTPRPPISFREIPRGHPAALAAEMDLATSRPADPKAHRMDCAVPAGEECPCGE